MKQSVRSFSIALPLMLVLTTIAVINFLPPAFQLLLIIGVPLPIWGTHRALLATDADLAARSHEISVAVFLTVAATLLAFLWALGMVHAGSQSPAAMSALRATTLIITVFAVLRMQMHVAPHLWSLFNGPAANRFRPVA